MKKGRSRSKLPTTVVLDDESKEELHQIREKLIRPFFGDHDQSQAVRYAIKYCFQHGVENALKVGTS